MKGQETTSQAEKLLLKTYYKQNYKGIYQTCVKRVLDILIVLLILPLVIIFLTPFIIAIKIEDHGPAFYKSKRIGKDFSEFNMLKLRSMKVNAPDIRNNDGSTYNSKDDSRVTRVGRLIRETSIDEIPQFFNVLKGEMSLIGPRAGDVESKDTYLDDDKHRTLVRPGISGYTQAYFRNGLGVREKRLYDAWYAHNVTFAMDVKIVIKTVITVLKRENLYTNDATTPPQRD